MSGVVNVWFYTGGGERLRWWTSGVVKVWFYTGGGERLGWWTSDFTLGVVNVWGGERLGGERLTIFSQPPVIWPELQCNSPGLDQINPVSNFKNNSFPEMKDRLYLDNAAFVKLFWDNIMET